MKNDSQSVRPLNIVFLTIILATLLFSFPFQILLPPGYLSLKSIIQLFSIEAISALSLAVLLTKRRLLVDFFRKYYLPALALSTILVIETIRVMIKDTYTGRDFMYSIILFVLPAAIFTISSELKKYSYIIFSLIWIINTLHCFCEPFRMSGPCTGISGNINWNASLILATTPFATYFLYNYLRNKKASPVIRISLSSIPVAISIFFLYLCDSRGAYLSLAIILLLLIVIYFYELNAKIVIRLLLLLGIFLFIFTLFYGSIIADSLFRDVRFSLWHSTLRLFLDNPILGVGSPSFESEYAKYRPIDYFIRSQHFAYRTIHPHNQLLFILASLGIAGTISWIVLWIYPIVKLFLTFKALDITTKIALVSLSILVIHSMFDLVLFQWPTMFVACLLLAIIWRKCWPLENSTAAIPSTEPTAYRIFISLSASACFLLFILFSFQDLMCSLETRYSDISMNSGKSPSLALASIDMAIDYKAVPSAISHCGVISSSIFSDQIMALHYFNRLLDTSCPQIANSNRHIAECLLKLGRKEEALIFLRKDVNNFPISIISLYMQMSLENDLGRKNEAELTAAKLVNALVHKGLTEKHIPEILANPYYDNKFVELRNKDK